MKKKKEIMKNIWTTVLLVAFAGVLLGVFVIPDKIEEYKLQQFAKPLFAHSVPENSYSVYSSIATDDEGGTTAAAILGTQLTEEELYEFYADTEYPPAKEGDTVELSVKALDEDSLTVLQEAGKYREEDQYYFIYIYSSRAE